MIINIVNFIGLIILFIFAEQILNIAFGTSSDLSVYLVRVFSILMLLDIPSIMIGYPLLGAMGYTNYANYSVVAVAIFYLLLLLILYLLNILNVKMVAWLYVLAVIVELSIRLFGVYKYKLLTSELK